MRIAIMNLANEFSLSPRGRAGGRGTGLSNVDSPWQKLPPSATFPIWDFAPFLELDSGSLAFALLSFVIGFDNPRWYAPAPFTFALVAALCAICWALWRGSSALLRLQLPIYSAGLFVCCMVCHGELYRLKPDPRRLTAFYLM